MAKRYKVKITVLKCFQPSEVFKEAQMNGVTARARTTA